MLEFEYMISFSLVSKRIKYALIGYWYQKRELVDHIYDFNFKSEWSKDSVIGLKLHQCRMMNLEEPVFLDIYYAARWAVDAMIVAVFKGCSARLIAKDIEAFTCGGHYTMSGYCGNELTIGSIDHYSMHAIVAATQMLYLSGRKFEIDSKSNVDLHNSVINFSQADEYFSKISDMANFVTIKATLDHTAPVFSTMSLIRYNPDHRMCLRCNIHQGVCIHDTGSNFENNFMLLLGDVQLLMRFKAKKVELDRSVVPGWTMLTYFVYLLYGAPLKTSVWRLSTSCAHEHMDPEHLCNLSKKATIATLSPIINISIGVKSVDLPEDFTWVWLWLGNLNNKEGKERRRNAKRVKYLHWIAANSMEPYDGLNDNSDYGPDQIRDILSQLYNNWGLPVALNAMARRFPSIANIGGDSVHTCAIEQASATLIYDATKLFEQFVAVGQENMGTECLTEDMFCKLKM
jgi:hypothetical protein